MKDQARPWESVFAGPEITAVPGDEGRFEEKAADTPRTRAGSRTDG